MKIKVYSTDACPYCHMAKDYIRSKGFEFEDINVSNDSFAAQEMIEKSGQMGVPVIDIDGKIIVGFDVPMMDKLLDKAQDNPVESNNSSGVLYDVIIVGGSAAGLTAALYSSRREMKTLVITKDIGGQMARTTEIENYSGLEKVDGTDLAKRFESQARGFGAEIIMKNVVKISQSEIRGQKIFTVSTCDHEYNSKTVIIASGKTPRNLGVPGEDEFSGKGVSYCATCDAPLFKGKTVAVVGGGNSALDAALLLSKIARKVYLIHRRSEFRAFENVVNEAKTKSNIELVMESKLSEIRGDNFVNSIIVSDDSCSEKEIKVDGVFVEIGSDVDTGFVGGNVDVDDLGQIKTNKHSETSCQGIFAAGDVTDTPFKQIVVAAGEGCKAALAAYNYIHGLENKYVADWAGHK